MPALLKKLIDRGDKVMIENGLLNIETHSKITPPESWLKTNEDRLIEEIVRSFKLRLYKYSDYNLGRTKGHSKDRLTLNFIEILTGETISLIFNVDRKKSALPKMVKKVTLYLEGSLLLVSEVSFMSYGQNSIWKSRESHQNLIIN